MTLVVDFDDLPGWAPEFGRAVTAVAPAGILARLQNNQFEYVEDAASMVRDEIGVHRLTEAINAALATSMVRLYHGTRISLADEASIRRHGLLPLARTFDERSAALAEILSAHPRWPDVSAGWDRALRKVGVEEYAGRRLDDRVHACFSKAGLTRGCSHYLHVGGEVDNHIMDLVFGDRSALPLLTAARRPALVTFVRPFGEALAAANPYGFPQKELPSLMGLLLNAWAWGVARPGFDPATLADCTAAWFNGPITDLENISIVQDGDLGPP